MGQKIRLSEAQLKKIIAESVRRALAENINEISPEFYKDKADSARGKMGKLPAKVRGFFDPEWKAKKERQIDKFDDYSQDHPDDEWDFEYTSWSTPQHDNAFVGKNQRTGERRCLYNDADDEELRIRGKVAHSEDPNKQAEADYLNSIPKKSK